MTRQVVSPAKCRKCNENGVCPNCGGKIHRFSPFSDWLRGLPAPLNSRYISNQNLDYIWHNYREDWFITIEEKQYGSGCPPAQQDTHNIVFQLLQMASRLRNCVIAGFKKKLKYVEYRGHYVISFEKTTPSNSKWIRVIPSHGKETKVDRGGLICLLTTGYLNTIKK